MSLIVFEASPSGRHAISEDARKEKPAGEALKSSLQKPFSDRQRERRNPCSK